jgi:hypothetical protein
MPSFATLNDRCGGQRLLRLLALLLALAVSTSVLLADDGDRDHGRFVDPIVGSWIVHVTVDTYTPTPSFPLPFQFDALQSFWQNGITITSDPTTGTAYGVWKRSGLPRTYDFKFLWIVPPALGLPPGTIRTGLPGPIVLNPQGTQMTGPWHGFDTDPNGMVIAQFSGTVVIDRITFSSTP